MKNYRKILSVVMTAAMAASLAACGNSTTNTGSTTNASSSDAAQTSDAAATESAAGTSSDGKKYTIGICQQLEHPALDQATQGFEDALTELLGADNVTFDLQNAQGEQANCATINNGFVSNNYDLIMANATTALQCAASATSTIPVIGTSVTDYATALDIDNWTGSTGTNVSGTADLAPIDQQEDMLVELFPDAKNVGILYCSAEPNSVYQSDVVKQYLENAGLTVNVYTFADSNDVSTVTATACAECDALYIPTDNTAASCTEAINNVAEPAGIPIVTGEEGLCKGCGIATLSISYYDLGVTTGKMAAKILTGEADISEMPIEYFQNPVKKYAAERCAALGIEIPSDYVAIEG